ncbi:piggyBac transposable element-derived protein 4 [Caerostris darwini]|uniref:PiggyBac transposable element-derived protein 4 n=1 Tax=Caerostris darwini TaxID=1538125 RepID=A0AAV4TBT7_9ARAC|nr:piggyBac transposable element-derived protein 4 [Caerostris darwini]
MYHAVNPLSSLPVQCTCYPKLASSGLPVRHDSCSELSSDEDLSSARIFTEVDVKNPPVPCPRFKFSGISSVHVQFEDTSDVLQFYETFIDFSLMSKIVEETNKYAKQCSVARQFSKILGRNYCGRVACIFRSQYTSRNCKETWN